MNRALLTVIACLALAGCNEARLKKAQARLDAANKARAAFEASHVRALEGDVGALKEQLKSIDNRRGNDERQLTSLQSSLAATWNGNPDLMKKAIAFAKVPA